VNVNVLIFKPAGGKPPLGGGKITDVVLTWLPRLKKKQKEETGKVGGPSLEGNLISFELVMGGGLSPGGTGTINQLFWEKGCGGTKKGL